MNHKITDFFEYNLYKAGLFSDNSSLIEIAKNNVGIHSARISSPYVLCASRNSAFKPKDLYNGLYTEKSLIKLRCMRTTLHIVSVTEAAIYHMATKDLRIKIENTKLKKLGINNTQIAYIKVKLNKNLLTPMSTEEMYNNCKITRLSKVQFNAIIKYLWEDGFLCYVNTASNWQKEERKFAITFKFYNGLNLNSMPAKEAQTKLFTNYLKHFGPVTLKDASWWSGISQTTIKNIWESLKDTLILDMDGETYYMLKEDYNKFLQYKAPNDYVKLLAYEDSALKAYYTSRTRYANQPLQQKIFNIIGEVHPVIVFNGKVVGKWSFNKRTNSPECILFKKISKCANNLLQCQVSSYKQRLSDSRQLSIF